MITITHLCQSGEENLNVNDQSAIRFAKIGISLFYIYSPSEVLYFPLLHISFLKISNNGQTSLITWLAAHYGC